MVDKANTPLDNNDVPFSVVFNRPASGGSSWRGELSALGATLGRVSEGYL
jgi:hypothetical protein